MLNGACIEITRNRIDAAIVRRSRVVRCHRFWRSEDSTSPDAIESDVREALAMLGPRPGHVHVIWSAPGAAVDLCPVLIPGPQGLRAARLGHAAAASLNPFVDPVAVVDLDSEKRKSTDPNTQRFAVAAGLPMSVWSAIQRGVSAAHGTLGSVIASPALTLRAAVAPLLHEQSDELIVCVRVDEDVSAIAIRAGGQIALARTVDLGASALRRSYEMALRDAGHTDPDPRTHAISELAHSLLHTIGVPPQDAELPHGISADVVFQLMRPALQRLVFEVKQSIRFTALDASPADDQSTPRAIFRMAHASIPNLASLIARECQACETGPAPAGGGAPGAAIERVIARFDPDLRLIPPTDTATVSARRFRIATFAGCALALALVGADAWSAHDRARSLDQQADASEEQLAAMNTPDDAERAAARAAEDSRAIVVREIAPIAPWSRSVALVASEFGDAVRILRVGGERNDDRSVLRIDAELSVPTAAEGRQRLAQAIDRLSADPWVFRADIPVIEQESRTDSAALLFTLELTLREAPAPWAMEVSQ